MADNIIWTMGFVQKEEKKSVCFMSLYDNPSFMAFIEGSNHRRK